MNLRDLLSHPLSGIRAWIAAHERFVAVDLTWGLALVFLAVSLRYLFKSLGLIP